MTRVAFTGAQVYDGQRQVARHALLLDGARVEGIVPESDLPPGTDLRRLDGGILFPGFVDLQVNGAGGLLFNDQTTVDGLRTMSAALRRTGTTAFLPTLITDTPDRTRAAIAAVRAAVAADVPGVAGLHLEGPHLALSRKGAHDPALIRPMTDEDEALLLEAARVLPRLLVTLAPETVPPQRIRRLTQAGVLVSLGHSDCTHAQATHAIDAGARLVTHLFNAMSQLGSREPGLVGAALTDGRVSAGLIADGIHVHPASLRAALAAKAGPGRLFLVTDAMATLGSDLSEFRLNGRRVLRRDGRLTLEDGTLAGADLEMAQAVRVLGDKAGQPVETALEMATSVPGDILGGHGRFTPGVEADVFHLTPEGARDLTPRRAEPSSSRA